MINWFKNEKHFYFWVVVHVLLAVVALSSSVAILVWFLCVIFSSMALLIFNRNDDGIVHFFLMYVIGMEMLARIMHMEKSHLPYELGKYACLFFFVLGIINEQRKRRFTAGQFILLLSLPSVSFADLVLFKQFVVFNYFGILNLALALIYFSAVTISMDELRKLLRVGLLSIISMTVFITLKAPNLSETDFILGANKDASGGFGPNQVSTVLGFGMVILFYSLYVSKPVFGNRLFDFGLIGFFGIRSLVTFSRGGVLGAVVGIVLIYLFPGKGEARAVKRAGNLKLLLVFIIVGTGVFLYVDNLTGNMLSLRFQGETAGTLAGSKDKDFNAVTSGRFVIMQSDFKMWMDNFFIGVGPGRADDIRAQDLSFQGNILAHNEMSRLMAEHGLFGMIINLILVFFPLRYLKTLEHPVQKSFAATMFFLALFSCQHSAMRTIITPFLYGLATIHIIPEEDRRKVAISQ